MKGGTTTYMVKKRHRCFILVCNLRFQKEDKRMWIPTFLSLCRHYVKTKRQNSNRPHRVSAGTKHLSDMKNIKNILAAGLFAMLSASCAHYTTDAPIMGIANNSINTYVQADIDYKGAKKVSGEVETKILFGVFRLSRNGDKQLTNLNRYRALTKMERQALYRAKENNNVDIIMEPEFSTEKHSWFFGAYKTRKVSVEGWGVNMKGIKEDTIVNQTSVFHSPTIGIFK